MAEKDFAGVNATLTSLGIPFKLAIVRPDDLEFLKKNARFMKNETFRNLVENVKRDRGLSSLPFCWLNEGKYHVLSGNHRLKAGIEAGLTEFLILYDDRPLSPEERVAIQLSHNSVAGEDDPAILKDLWGEIDNLALKYYAGLDDQVLGTLDKMQIDTLSAVRLEYRTVSFVLLPEEADKLKIAFDVAAAEFKPAHTAYLARLRDFDRLLDALEKVKKAKQVFSAATALTAVLDCFDATWEKYLASQQPKEQQP